MCTVMNISIVYRIHDIDDFCDYCRMIDAMGSEVSSFQVSPFQVSPFQVSSLALSMLAVTSAREADHLVTRIVPWRRPVLFRQVPMGYLQFPSPRRGTPWASLGR